MNFNNFDLQLTLKRLGKLSKGASVHSVGGSNSQILTNLNRFKKNENVYRALLMTFQEALYLQN